MNITRFIAAATTVATLSSAALPALALGPDVDHERGLRKENLKERILQRWRENMANIQGRFDDKREEVQVRRQGYQERLSDKLQEKLSAFWERAAARIERIIGRLVQLAERIEERLTRLSDAGKDVSEQRELLAQARTEIDEARAALRAASAEVDDIIANNVPREAFAQLRDLHRRVMIQVREAHQALIEVIKSIRGLSDVE